MIRTMFAGLLISTVVGSAGCRSEPDGSFVYQIKMKDYDVEFDGHQKKATIAEDHFLIVRIPEDIRVSEGTLQVGRREYGEVHARDKISVVGGKVSVNGRERKPLGS